MRGYPGRVGRASLTKNLKKFLSRALTVDVDCLELLPTDSDLDAACCPFFSLFDNLVVISWKTNFLLGIGQPNKNMRTRLGSVGNDRIWNWQILLSIG